MFHVCTLFSECQFTTPEFEQLEFNTVFTEGERVLNNADADGAILLEHGHHGRAPVGRIGDWRDDSHLDHPVKFGLDLGLQVDGDSSCSLAVIWLGIVLQLDGSCRTGHATNDRRSGRRACGCLGYIARQEVQVLAHTAAQEVAGAINNNNTESDVAVLPGAGSNKCAVYG